MLAANSLEFSTRNRSVNGTIDAAPVAVYPDKHKYKNRFWLFLNLALLDGQK